MEIHVTKEAAKWYTEEVITDASPYIRLFPRYGSGGHIPGFSLGISNEKPMRVYRQTRVENIIFYIEEDDEWYFEGKDISISLNKMNEPQVDVR